MLIKNPKTGVKFLPKNGKFRQPGITLCYRVARDRLAAEVFHFNQDQKVTKAFAHYSTLKGSS